MSNQKSDNSENKVNSYVLRAARRIIIPNGDTSIDVSIGDDSVKVESSKQNPQTDTGPVNSEELQQKFEDTNE